MTGSQAAYRSLLRGVGDSRALAHLIETAASTYPADSRRLHWSRTIRSPTRDASEVGPDTSVGANQDFNLQTPAPACVARIKHARIEDTELDVLPIRLHATGGAIVWIQTQRIVIQS